MSKSIANIQIATLDEKKARAKAVFDSGSFFTILRENMVPEGAVIVKRKSPKEFNTAAVGGKLTVTGEIPIVMTIGDRVIEDLVLLSPNLSQELLIGAGTMQKWGISIENKNGETGIIVGRNLSDPDITEID
jgi:hypothetical protein